MAGSWTRTRRTRGDAADFRGGACGEVFARAGFAGMEGRAGVAGLEVQEGLDRCLDEKLRYRLGCVAGLLEFKQGRRLGRSGNYR